MSNGWIITIQKLLSGRNDEFDNCNKKRVKILRHKDTRDGVEIGGVMRHDSPLDLYLYDRKTFYLYQSEQLESNFKNVDYFVSFLGEEGKSCRFIGVYKNYGILKALKDYNGKKHNLYDFKEVSGFEALKERVVIEWRGGVRNWLVYYDTQEMPVIRIDKGLMENHVPIFTRYEDVVLSYNQLKTIFDSAHPNMEWKAKLDCCNCIYLIFDKGNGKQYIGSTYNKDGIWGRWKEYALNGHGDDKDLNELIAKDKDYAEKNFQWCILETLPLTITSKQAIDRESLYKRKIGTSKPFGYNNN